MTESTARFTLAALAALLVSCLGLFASPYAQASAPSPHRFAPHALIRTDLERYGILRVDTQVWRDGRLSGIPGRLLTRLPSSCWAIDYTFVWNDESPSPGHRPGTPDPEPVIVFVSDSGNVVGVQSRIHGFWAPINSAFGPWDFIGKTHLVIGFAANVHTPGAGLAHALAVLGVGPLPGDAALITRHLEDLILQGVIGIAGR